MHKTVELQSEIEDTVINIRIKKTRIKHLGKNLENSNSVKEDTRLDLEIKILGEEKLKLKQDFIKLIKELLSNVENL